MIRLLCVLLLVGCSARPAPPVWPAAAPDPLVVPLFAVHGARRPLVEAQINGQGPFLFVVDTRVAGGRLVASLAAELGLAVRGDPARGAQRVTVDRLTLAGTHLGAVTLTLADTPSWGAPYEDRPIAGALGTQLLSRGALEIDPGAGTLRLFAQRPAPPAGAQSAPLSPTGDGRLTVQARVLDTPLEALLATGAPWTRITPSRARSLELTPVPGTQPVLWRTPVAVAGAPQTTVVHPLHGPGAQAQIGWDLLRSQSLRVDGRTLYRWPVTPSNQPWSRLPQTAPCGPALSRCVAGTVVGVSAGRITLVFEPPTVPLPERLWARIDLGRSGTPLTVLVRLAPTAGHPYRAALTDHRITPETVRPVGSALNVVDVVPLGRPCDGLVCLR